MNEWTEVIEKITIYIIINNNSISFCALYIDVIMYTVYKLTFSNNRIHYLSCINLFQYNLRYEPHLLQRINKRKEKSIKKRSHVF